MGEGSMNYDSEQFAPDDPMSFDEWIAGKSGPLHVAYLKTCSRPQGSAETNTLNEGNENASESPDR